MDTIEEYAGVKDRSSGIRQYPMSLAFEMRFMSASQSFLCPAVVGKTAPGDDIKVACIEVLAFGNLETRPLWKKFAEELAQVKCQGR